jgi:hypothetical protein
VYLAVVGDCAGTLSGGAQFEVFLYQHYFHLKVQTACGSTVHFVAGENYSQQGNVGL